MNKTPEIKRLEKAIKAGQKGIARTTLQSIRSKAYQRYKYAEERAKKQGGTVQEREVAKRIAKTRQKEFEAIAKDVEHIRQSLVSTEKKPYQALTRLNVAAQKIQAEKRKLQTYQKEAKTIVGISLINATIQETYSALWEKYVLNSRGLNFSQTELNYIQDTLMRILNFDFNRAFEAQLDTITDYDSETLFEAMLAVVAESKIKYRESVKADKLSEDDLEDLASVFTIFEAKGVL